MSSVERLCHGSTQPHIYKDLEVPTVLVAGTRGAVLFSQTAVLVMSQSILATSG